MRLVAPAVESAPAPEAVEEPVGLPVPEPEARVVMAELLPEAAEPEGVGVPRMTVVLLLALTVMMAVPLPLGMATV